MVEEHESFEGRTSEREERKRKGKERRADNANQPFNDGQLFP